MKILSAITSLLLLTRCISAGDSIKSDTADWFPFQPVEEFSSPSPIDLSGWLDAPAGKHGFLQFDNESLVFEDGERIKFWGTNICSAKPYVEASEADRYADFLAYYGQNGVRFHKFTWHGYATNISTELAPKKYERFDYFHHVLREKGIYTGWSHIYGQRIQPGDRVKLLNYAEIKNLSYPWSHLNGTSSGLVNFAPDLQDLNIELTVKMLNHRNPHTGLRYADDPALAFVEFQNEDNIFWSAIERSLEQAPTYRALLCSMFSEWLLRKYQSETALVEAWGSENLPKGASLKEQNIYPNPSHSYFSHFYHLSLDNGEEIPVHVLDKMRFLYETQVRFYRKFEQAIRDTGYKGLLIGSCWQAGSGIAHFYNLHADYLVGMIDRHNYFGGGSGHQIKPSKIKHRPMLAEPGSGLLSLGMQQVEDRPFAISEWMSLPPNEWTAEAAPLVALYGLGLQGWDASFSFATDEPGFSSFVQSERHGVYNATSPVHLGLYPALARIVYRQDVKEGEVLATRNVHIPSLSTGRLDFEEIVTQDYDVKSFTGSVPSEALAIGKTPISFPAEDKDTQPPNLSPYWDRELGIIKSATKELEWTYGDQKGLVTVNTAYTVGLVGFPKGKRISLGDWSLQTPNPFAVILLTSLGQEPLSQSKQMLLTTIARSRNTGMEYTPSSDSLVSVGEAPLLLEPVDVAITSKVLYGATVEPLDHIGRRTGERIKISGQRLEIQGDRYRALYYLIER